MLSPRGRAAQSQFPSSPNEPDAFMDRSPSVPGGPSSGGGSGAGSSPAPAATGTGAFRGAYPYERSSRLDATHAGSRLLPADPGAIVPPGEAFREGEPQPGARRRTPSASPPSGRRVFRVAFPPFLRSREYRSRESPGIPQVMPSRALERPSPSTARRVQPCGPRPSRQGPSGDRRGRIPVERARGGWWCAPGSRRGPAPEGLQGGAPRRAGRR